MNREVIILLFPLLAAFMIPAGTIISKYFGRVLSLLAYVAGIIYGLLLMPLIMIRARSVIIGNWLPPFGINLFFSPLTLGLVLFIFLLALCILLFDLKNTESKKGQYYLLFNLLVTASAGLILTCDLFNIFVFLEIAGIASFSMIAAGRNSAGSVGAQSQHGSAQCPQGALKYLIQAQLTTLLMLGGIGLLYSATGVLNIAFLSSFEALKPSFAFLTLLLILLPLFLESKLFPFNSWVGGAYQGAEPSLAAALSGIAGTAAALVLARLTLTMMGSSSAFTGATEKIRVLLLLLGAASILIGETAAFREKNLKKVLAYSSIGQMGMVVAGIGIANTYAVRGALFLLLSHGAAKVLLFLTAGFFINKAGTPFWKNMKGLARRMPLAGAFFIIGAMALMGIPLLSGFWAKLELIRGAVTAGGLAGVVVAAILLATILEGVYFMRIGHSLFEEGEIPAGEGDDRDKTRYNAAYLIPCLALALSLIAAGLFPDLINTWLSSAAHELLNSQTDYTGLILKAGGGL
jgi:formate hydrogenlyase subunit 3/multisubunit Na+/H+ antiporter MnhD subunit